ncbi:MAG TPA: BTAD domain-containing putative transcriptional regulator [Candidatus Limnocylindrales bacterium]
MDFGILGQLRVSSGDGAVDLGSPAQRTLLAVLLSSPNAPVAADRLVDELWGENPPPSAHHLLEVYASRLRRAVDDPGDGSRIARRGDAYQLRVQPGELDADRFAAGVARGRVLGDRDPEAADEIMAAAMDMWIGPPFADLPAAPPAVRERIEYLEQLRLEGHKAWNDVRLRLGRHRDLVPELGELAARHPYDEAIHAQLMLALYRCGRQADALATARTLEARLREDLGLETTAEVRDRYRDILLQAPGLSLEPPEPPSNLPIRLTSFVGRAAELHEVTDLVTSDRLVTLTGPGGVGKTRLAIEVAERLRARFPDGVWWIDLAPVSEPDTILDQVASVIGIATPPGGSLATAVSRALSRRKALLLLDNCEHLAAAVGEVVAGLLRSTAGPRVLATSRTPLRVEGERRWMVPPLGLPAEREPLAAQAEASDAVRLFVERGRALRPGFALGPGNATAVVEVCRRLDGVSLAIEMAAARLPLLTPREIADRLDDLFTLLELPVAGRLTRHRSLQAAFDASYALLADADREAFERLSVFAGSFDLDAAAAVALPGGRHRPALEAMTSLVDASMVFPERADEHTRYRMLETLREYGRARLGARGGEDVARQAHTDHYLDLAASAGAVLGTPEFAPWMDRLAADYAEIRQALAWSLAHEARAVTLRAAPALREFWLRRGDAREAGRWTGRMLDGDLDSVASDLLADVYDSAAFGALISGDPATSRLLIDRSIRLARAGARQETLAAALYGAAQCYFGSGDLASVRRHATEMLDICDRGGLRWARAGALTSLGSAIVAGGGSLGAARAMFEEARPLYRELGDVGTLVLTLGSLTVIAGHQGDLEAAERYAVEALELGGGEQSGGRAHAWAASAFACYADVLLARGDSIGAAAAASRAMRIAADSGLENWFRIALREAAGAAAALERWRQAAACLGAARRDMPPYGPGLAVLATVETACRAALGADEAVRLARDGADLTDDQLLDLVGA